VALFQALEQLKLAIEAKHPPKQLQQTRNELHAQLSEAGFRLEYLDVYDVSTLAPFGESTLDQPLVVAGAGWMGDTRLIDNLLINTESNVASEVGFRGNKRL
jgi:pantoate--beta-alanine ligase